MKTKLLKQLKKEAHDTYRVRQINANQYDIEKMLCRNTLVVYDTVCSYTNKNNSFRYCDELRRSEFWKLAKEMIESKKYGKIIY